MMHRNWVFWTISLALVGVGVFLVSLPHYEFTTAFGHALIIAGILAITVDRFVKARLLREVSWDVSKYLIGYNLPQEVQDRIRTLMGTRLIRRNQDVRYRISFAENDPGVLKVEIEFSFEIENITGHMEMYQQYMAFEKHENPTIVELRCDSSDPNASYYLSGQNLAANKDDEPGVVQATGKKIKIQAHNRVRDITYRVAGRSYLMFRENHSDVLAFAAPTINVTITAEVPEGFRFVAPHADLATTNRWEYRRLFLPGEHIHVRWFKEGQTT